MSIAEKITTIAENVDKVNRSGYKTGYEFGFNAGDDHGYERGYADGKAEGGGIDLFQYVSSSGSTWQLFYKAEFPADTELVINLDNGPKSIYEMFRLAEGFKKLTMNMPVSGPYNGSYFLYSSSAVSSSLEELVLPEGVKFSNFSNFATYRDALHTVIGAIDLSESTSNASAFSNCPELTEIRFAPGTIKKSISFNESSKLSGDSIKSIVNGLADVPGQTLTVHATVYDQINESEITRKGWSLVQA